MKWPSCPRIPAVPGFPWRIWFCPTGDCSDAAFVTIMCSGTAFQASQRQQRSLSITETLGENTLSEPHGHIPKRFKIARRYQWIAAATSAVFVLCVFIGWPLGYVWPSAIGFLGFLPAVWLFNIKCHNCGYAAFSNYATDERLKHDERFWTRFWGQEYDGVHLPLPTACTKCGAPFI